MKWTPYRQAMLLAMTLLALAAGCAPQAFSRVSLNRSDHQAVADALAPDALQAADGYTAEYHNAWPTVIRLTHVAVPEGGLAEWKLELTGSVVHVIIYQSLSVDVRYEGPIRNDIEDYLRAPDVERESEFLAALVGFAADRIRSSLTAKWTDPAAVQDDRYRSRMLGLLESTLQEVRGTGRVSHDRYNVDVAASGGNSLRLRYLGNGLYRIELHGGAILAPAPVL